MIVKTTGTIAVGASGTANQVEISSTSASLVNDTDYTVYNVNAPDTISSGALCKVELMWSHAQQEWRWVAENHDCS